MVTGNRDKVLFDNDIDQASNVAGRHLPPLDDAAFPRGLSFPIDPA
jgi:hypothetical protein